MKRTIDSVIAQKQCPRGVAVRKRVPDFKLVYVAPSATIFSPWTKRLGFLVAVFLSPALAFSFSTNAAFSDNDQLLVESIGHGRADAGYSHRGEAQLHSSLFVTYLGEYLL